MERSKEDDVLILTTTSLFNYVSIDLLAERLSANSTEQACGEVGDILTKTASTNDAFACFFLTFAKAEEPKTADEEPVVENKEEDFTFPSMVLEEDLYAPLSSPSAKERLFEKLSGIQKFKPKIANPLSFLKKLNLSSYLPPFPSFTNRFSAAEKFFLATFLILIIILGLNLALGGFRSYHGKKAEDSGKYAETINQLFIDVESALAIKNEEKAGQILKGVEEELAKLRELDEEKWRALKNEYDSRYMRVNRITVIEHPKVAANLKFPVSHVARAGSGFLFSGKDDKSLAYFDGENFRQIFLLNGLDGEIKGLLHVTGLGHLVLTRQSIYRINEELKQFEKLAEIKGADLFAIKHLPPNRLYVSDRTANQVVRFQIVSGKLQNKQNLLKTAANFSNIQDFGLDTDVYLLAPDKLRKFASGNEQALRLQILHEPLAGAEKILIGTNIYILEPSAQRVLIYSKNGSLMYQLKFPNMELFTNFYVDESEKRMYLVDKNKLLEITF
jgi:hypothetical protein